jgi:dihydroxyacetone kinase
MASTSVNGDLSDVEFIIRTIAQTAVENEQHFGDLDAVVGDGDFGYSLARGFEVVLAEFDTIDRTTIATFIRKTGMIVTSQIGGTSGPLWGTGFLRAAAAAGTKTQLDAADAVAMLRAAVEGIKARGQSDLGDKTLLDAQRAMRSVVCPMIAARTFEGTRMSSRKLFPACFKV